MKKQYFHKKCPITINVLFSSREEIEEEEVSDESDGYESDYFRPLNVPLTDASAIIKAFKNPEETEAERKAKELMRKAEAKKEPLVPTFNGKWSSDEEGIDDDSGDDNHEFANNDSNHHEDQHDDNNDNYHDDVPDNNDGFSSSDDEFLVKKKPKLEMSIKSKKIPQLTEERPMPKLTPKPKPKRGQNAGTRSHFWSHKRNIMVGKIGCKYCETFFSTKPEKEAHKCKYLKCDPKNFICRVCGKELSKRTFSNHLHETLACEYCKKTFVNPRNMKEHIKKQHSDKEFKHSQAVLFADRQKEHEMHKNIRLECGKLFTTLTILEVIKFISHLRFVWKISLFNANDKESYANPHWASENLHL